MGDIKMAQKNSIQNDPCYFEGKASMKCVVDNMGTNRNAITILIVTKSARNFGTTSTLVEDKLTLSHIYLQFLRDRHTSKNMCKQKKSQYLLMMTQSKNKSQ